MRHEAGNKRDCLGHIASLRCVVRLLHPVGVLDDLAGMMGPTCIFCVLSGGSGLSSVPAKIVNGVSGHVSDNPYLGIHAPSVCRYSVHWITISDIRTALLMFELSA